MEKIKSELNERSLIEFDLDTAREQAAIAETRLADCNGRIALLKQTMVTARELDAALPPKAAPQPAKVEVAPEPRQPVVPKPAPAKATKPAKPAPKRRGRPPNRPRPEPIHDEDTKFGQGGKTVAQAAAE